MSEEPKPCPFCGGGPTVFYGPQRENFVRCSACKAMTGGETSGAAAVSTWNRRAARDEEVAKLREALLAIIANSDEKNEWDAVDKLEQNRETARAALEGK